MRDGDELTAGTDANDADSIFRITQELWDCTNKWLMIYWSSVTGREYSVMNADTLSLPFTNVPGFANMPGAACEMGYTNTSPRPSGEFYRIRVNVPD